MIAGDSGGSEPGSSMDDLTSTGPAADAPDLFTPIWQRIEAGSLSLPELIEAAGRLSGGGERSAARQAYQGWIAANPRHPQLCVAHFNYATLANQARDHRATLAALQEAIRLNPDFIPAYINLGRLLEDMGNPGPAVAAWQTGVNRPVPVNGTTVRYAMIALKQMVRVLSDRQDHAGAEEAARRCLQLDPHQQEVIEQFIALRLAQCAWPAIEPWDGMDRAALMRGMHPLSAAIYMDDPFLQLALADRANRLAGHAGRQDPALDRRNATIDLSARRLRVGYVSSDLRDHAIGTLMAELFEVHDRARVDVFVFYMGRPTGSPITARIKSTVEHWVDIHGHDDDAAARLIADAGIDILVDINGYTRDARTGIFARRPAPIQVNWLGYAGSMATPFHHYIIADETTIPPESEIYYAERVVRLPCYQPNDRRRAVTEATPSRHEAGLPEDAFVFCCFNGTHKISHASMDRWLEILRRVPGGVLWMLETSAATMTRLRQYAEEHDVAGQRLVFAPRLANPDHLARYRLADLFLDTSPYGAHTTASDALWVGLPVLTFPGLGFAARVCSSLVRAAGLGDFVARDPLEYVERAVELAHDRDTLRALKARLAAARDTCRLFDTDALARHLEELYHGMCADYRSGSLPQPDLRNLAAYLEAAIARDHDAVGAAGADAYHAEYRRLLTDLDRARPLWADGRLWRAERG